MKIVIQVVHFETEQVVHEVDVTNQTDRQREKIERGMNINLNHNEYFTREEEIEDRELIRQ